MRPVLLCHLLLYRSAILSLWSLAEIDQLYHSLLCRSAFLRDLSPRLINFAIRFCTDPLFYLFEISQRKICWVLYVILIRTVYIFLFWHILFILCILFYALYINMHAYNLLSTKYFIFHALQVDIFELESFEFIYSVLCVPWRKPLRNTSLYFINLVRGISHVSSHQNQEDYPLVLTRPFCKIRENINKFDFNGIVY